MILMPYQPGGALRCKIIVGAALRGGSNEDPSWIIIPPHDPKHEQVDVIIGIQVPDVLFMSPYLVRPDGYYFLWYSQALQIFSIQRDHLARYELTTEDYKLIQKKIVEKFGL